MLGQVGRGRRGRASRGWSCEPGQVVRGRRGRASRGWSWVPGQVVRGRRGRASWGWSCEPGQVVHAGTGRASQDRSCEPGQIVLAKRSRMEEAVSCGCCSEVYEKGPHEPLVLSCGHTFCRTCITSVMTTGNCLCPTCRSSHRNVVVNKLAINYSLLSISLTLKEFLCDDTCSKHGDELKYWCRECKVALCSLCLYSEHQNGHHVHLAKAYIQERKSELKDDIKLIIDKNVAEKKKKILSNFYNSIQELRQHCQTSTFLHDFETDMNLLSTEVEKVCSIESLFLSEEKVKNIELQKLNSMLSESSEAEVAGEPAASELAEAGATASAAEESKTAAVVTTQQMSPATNQTVESHYARLDFRDGKLLLHPFTRNVDSHLYFKMPSEVFLELSAGGRCLGRVYIQLKSHLRRAQQFLALCLGTLGPSFVGSSIGSAGNMDQVNEYIAVDYYIDQNGERRQHNLLTDVNTDDQHQGPATEGTLAALNVRSNLFGFVIYTRGQPGGYPQCPYGQVSSGLEVVQTAIRHDPVTEVTITDCGLVIPDHAP
nr:uncharacterized protein LOC123768093 [Procambarus clarkii]XP_045614345.1 uncharacterized protein LOC123768093 [Procambarus clarkii]XP_045614346.1 uncharacterized protein LOC123768093 [Procambarus clarkii]